MYKMSQTREQEQVKSAVQVPLTGKGFSDITDTLNTLF